MQEELFGAIQDVESPAEGGTSLAIEIPMEDDPIVRRPVRKRQNALADLLDGWQDRRRQTSLIWGGVALGALLVLMLIVWAMREPTKVAGPPPVPPPHQTPPVDARADLGPVLVVGDAGDFATIGEALKHIQEHRQRYTDTPSWTVKVAGGRTYPEAIVISNSGMSGEAFPAGVEIVSDGEAPAVLRPAGTEPVVELDGVARLTLRGFVLDGTGRETVLRLAGFLVGTRLENLQLRELNGAGIQWDDIVCLPEAPLELVNLHFDGEGAAAVGVRMGDTRQVRYDRCVFTGPMAAGIEFTADVWNTGVSVRHSRFFDVQTGLRFTGNAQDIQRVSVVNNTFHSVQHALAWDHMPQAGSSGLLVHHNLFARMSGPAAIIREGFDPSRAQELLAEGGALNNWTDRPADSAAGGVAILDLFERGERAVQNLSFESTDPASPGFLKPTAPPVTIELKSRAQEADPIVGAIAP